MLIALSFFYILIVNANWFGEILFYNFLFYVKTKKTLKTFANKQGRLIIIRKMILLLCVYILISMNHVLVGISFPINFISLFIIQFFHFLSIWQGTFASLI